MTTIYLIFFMILSLVLSYIVYMKMIQVNKYQEVIDIYDNRFNDMSDTLKVVLNEMDALDSSGIYRSDDEVGYFFQSLYTLIKSMDDFVFVDDSTIKPESYVSGSTDSTDSNDGIIIDNNSFEILKRKYNRMKDDVTIDDIKKGATKNV